MLMESDIEDEGIVDTFPESDLKLDSEVVILQHRPQGAQVQTVEKERLVDRHFLKKFWKIFFDPLLWQKK